MKEKKMDQSVDAPGEEFSLIPHATLMALYRNLLECRKNGVKGRRRGAGNAWPFDAAAVAVAAKIVAEDTIVADGPSRVSPLIANGCRSMQADGSFSTLLQIAMGTALAHKTKKTGKIACVFAAGDHGEAWRDALEIARTHRLPMVFVWNSKTHGTELGQSRRKGAAIEPGTELAQITSDGNDVVAMYRVAHEAVERARRDRGPTLIECIPFQFGGSKHRDPLANMESYLRGKGLMRRGLRHQLLEEIARDPHS